MKCEKGTLYNGTRVTVSKIFNAGSIYISKVEIMSEKLRLEISGGQPFNSAYRKAEQLAITTDSELVLDHEVIRPSLNAEYYKASNP